MLNYPVICPVVPEDFSRLWPAEYRGKVVLDIGADRGSTASYFLRQGAAFVTCVEGNCKLYDELVQNLPSLVNCQAIFKWIRSSKDMAEMLRYGADIVKIDVEGAEKHLLDVNPWLIQQHPEYMVEVHWGVDMDAIIWLFDRCCFHVTLGARGIGWQIIHCKL